MVLVKNMITVSLLGMDQYSGSDVSLDLGKPLADAYEVKNEEIVFYVPDSFIFHSGHEQTSFQLNVVVSAPKKYSSVEKTVANVLLKVLQNYSVHIHVQFVYFDSEYEHINEEYPRFMNDDNVVDYDAEDAEEDPYLGDAFAAVKEYLEEDDEDEESEEWKAECDDDECEECDGECDEDCDCDHDDHDHGDTCCCHHHH